MSRVGWEYLSVLVVGTVGAGKVRVNGGRLLAAKWGGWGAYGGWGGP